MTHHKAMSNVYTWNGWKNKNWNRWKRDFILASWYIGSYFWRSKRFNSFTIILKWLIEIFNCFNFGGILFPRVLFSRLRHAIHLWLCDCRMVTFFSWDLCYIKSSCHNDINSYSIHNKRLFGDPFFRSTTVIYIKQGSRNHWKSILRFETSSPWFWMNILLQCAVLLGYKIQYIRRINQRKRSRDQVIQNRIRNTL